MRTLLATFTVFMFASVATASDKIPAPSVLIITGDHTNDWQKTTSALKTILTEAGHRVDVLETPSLELTLEKLSAYDVLLLNYRSTLRGAKVNPASVWTSGNRQALAASVKAGTGLVVAHGASLMLADDATWNAEALKLTASGWQDGRSRHKMHPLTLTVQHDHPITRGLGTLEHGLDKLQQNLQLAEGSKVLVTAFDGREMDEPVVWFNHYGKGRVVQCGLGYNLKAIRSEAYQTLIRRSVQWASEKGFRTIFDGETLAGWEGNNRYWRVENGAIVGGSLARPMPFHDFLCSIEQFEDFELRLEAKVVGQRNSGVCVRSRRQKLQTSQKVVGYEVDMGVFRWGWVYEEGGDRQLLNGNVQNDLQPKIQKVLRQGEFNDLVIRCQGNLLTAWLNGVKFEYQEQDEEIARQMRKGTIGLQLHNGRAQEVSFRNIRIKELPTVR